LWLALQQNDGRADQLKKRLLDYAA